VLLDPNLENSGDVQKLGVVHSHATQRDARKTDFQYDLDPATALILAARIVDCNHYAINRRFANLFIDVTQLEIRATLLSMSFALMSGVPDMFVIQLESASKMAALRDWLCAFPVRWRYNLLYAVGSRTSGAERATEALPSLVASALKIGLILM